MKKENLHISVSIMAALLLPLCWGVSTRAQTTTSRTSCTVETDQDYGSFIGEKITLRKAVELASSYTPSERRRCTNTIRITTSTIKMKKPLMIQVPQTSELLIEGSDPANPVQIDFTEVEAYDSNAMSMCVITLKHPSAKITLRNIKIVGSPVSGVCVGSLEDNKPVHGIKFENFHIDNAVGHGIIFRSGSSNSLISATSSIEQTGGNAIKYLGTAEQEFNRIEATNRLEDGTDENTGLSKLQDRGDDTKNFRMLSIGKAAEENQEDNFISSEREIRVRINKVDQFGGPGSTVFLVEGDVVTAGPNDDICQAPRVLAPSNIKRLQIYAVSPGDASGKNGSFYSYVNPKNGAYGIDTRTRSQGSFKFKVDKNEINNATLIVIVPELNTNQIAGSSKIVRVEDLYSDCSGGVRNTGNGVGNGVPLGDVERLWSIQHCNSERDRDGDGRLNTAPEVLGPEYDSDGDGLADIEEDTNGDCIPNEGDFSDWTKPDSDGDGIPDGREKRGGILLSREERNGPPVASSYQFCQLVNEVDPCNVDGKLEEEGSRQAQSNAWDPDSDEDGLLDYEEDRQRVLNPWKRHQGHFVYEGTEYACTVESLSGVDWNVYLVTDDGENVSFAKHEFAEFGEEYLRIDPATQRLVTIKCQSDAIKNTDFNGNKDNAETDPYNADSDGDGFCDAGGEACDLQKPRDNCPTEHNLTNNCTPACIVGEDLYRIEGNEANRQFLVFSASDTNEPVGLEDRDRNLIPDIYENANYDLLNSICPSRDGDLIPDCVERMNPECRRDVQFTLSLNPYSPDSDGDGFPDHLDKNPYIWNANNVIDSSEGGYLRTIFDQAAISIVKCFTDRDGDGLRECEEDKNKDSRYDRKLGLTLEQFLAERDTIESDPLNGDSDDDGLSDKEEVQLGTNPLAPDTDGDRLHDRTEVKSNQDSYADAGATCGGFVPVLTDADLSTRNRLAKTNDELRIGTNPLNPDTDGDGIPDGVEIVGTLINTVSELANGFIRDLNLISHPLSKDSDGDGLTDAQEYAKSGVEGQIAPDGALQHYESSPCHTDTDGDGIADNEPDLCPTSRNATCRAPAGGFGPNTDGDSLADGFEATLETSPKHQDSDGDGLNDDVEDANGSGTSDPGETNPVNPDSDGDGLADGLEVQLGTDPLNVDSDGDGLRDDVELGFGPTPAGEDRLQRALTTVTVYRFNGSQSQARVVKQLSYTPGIHTDPKNPDTDADGLCDGNLSVTLGGVAGNATCLRGEDINQNGIVDMDPKDPNRFMETDPRNPDTDGDGESDKSEICHGGSCNLAANLGRATQGRSEGCFSVSGAHSGGPTSILYLFGLVFLLNRFEAFRMRRKKV